MVSIRPVPRALTPVDSNAAQQISGPNYDEFQSDREIWDILQRQPDCILRVTMAHCDVASKDQIGIDGSPESLAHAGQNMRTLVESDLTQITNNTIWVYEIEDRRRPNVRQIGLGCCALISEIRTDQNPQGVIIRNEGIRESKAEGRARLIESTAAFIGTVNNAVRDQEGRIASALETSADSRDCDFQATDEVGNVHKIWLINDEETIAQFSSLFAEQPCAYVADGNHRSAAAGILNRDEFVSVFFTTERMGLASYNRLVRRTDVTLSQLVELLGEYFEVQRLGDLPEFVPCKPGDIGLYGDHSWYRLGPKPSAFDPDNAVQSIDADIVQRLIFDAILSIPDARDERLNYVGGNKDSAYLKGRVDSAEFQFAIVLAPVTMDQFVAVCEQNRFMPPKSTWFEPKIRSGLVCGLLDD